MQLTHVLPNVDEQVEVLIKMPRSMYDTLVASSQGGDPVHEAFSYYIGRHQRYTAGDEATALRLATRIVEETAYAYGLTVDELKGVSRQLHVVRPRQLAMYLVRRASGLSFPKIGEMFGNRDHTTVMHAETAVEKRLEEDDELTRQVGNIRQRLGLGQAVLAATAV